MTLGNTPGYIKLSNTQKKLGAFFFLIFAVVLLPLLAISYYNLAISRPSQGFKETTFQIEEGESVNSVSKRLSERELVNSEFLFKFYLIVNGLQSSIQAGIYHIHAGASIEELAQIFQHGTNDVQITYLEGWRTEEFARHTTKFLNNFDYEGFVSMAKPYEGMLFPDTYYFNIESNEKEVLNKLIETFERKTQQVFLSSEFKNSGLSRDEVIKLASIVEREVSDENDRRIVAGILINRYRSGEILGADATTQYAVALQKFCSNHQDFENCPTSEQVDFIDWWPQQITIDDLKFDSPYNTRLVQGLPPKPIANPSLSSINSVITFIPTSYNYYLTDTNGMTHYSNTLEEHNLNIQQYLN